MPEFSEIYWVYLVSDKDYWLQVFYIRRYALVQKKSGFGDNRYTTQVNVLRGQWNEHHSQALFISSHLDKRTNIFPVLWCGDDVFNVF